MHEKLQQYSEIITRLAEEAVRCSPESWGYGTLFMQSDGVMLTYQLKSDANSERASISELLRDLIDELYTRMRASREAWTSAKLTWTHKGDDVQFDLNFDYLPQ